MKKILILTCVVAAALVVGYVVAGPFIALSQIKSGIQNGDSEKLTDYVDFPTLRENMKQQLNAYLIRQSANELKDNPFGALGMVLGQKMVEGLVDSFVTPAGLSNIAAGRKSQASGAKPVEPFQNAHYAYDSINRFSAWVPGENGGQTRFVLTRHGLSWKLTNIVVDFAGLKASDQANGSNEATGTSPGLTPVPQRSIKIESIDTRATEMNNVWARYAWKLSVSNLTGEPAQFNAKIEWQDSDGFPIDDDEAYGLSLGAHETQAFTGNKLISYPAASRVAKVQAKISQ